MPNLYEHSEEDQLSQEQEFSSHKARLVQLDPSLILGKICWYTITEDSMTEHAEFCQSLLTHNINTLPPVPRSSDVFKRACTAAQINRVADLTQHTYKNYLIRHVGSDADNIYRHLVVETIDTNGRTLDYREECEFRFIRSLDAINSRTLVDSLSANTEAVITSVFEYFKAWNMMLTAYTIREFVRRVIRGLSATLLRDGVYFVKEEHSDKIDALDEIVNSLAGGASMHWLPLIDDRKQRAMLRQAFEDESVGEIDRLLGDIGEILRGDKQITSDRFADYKVEYDRLLHKTAEYSDFLDSSMQTTASRLEMMDEVLFELMGKVKT